MASGAWNLPSITNPSVLRIPAGRSRVAVQRVMLAVLLCVPVIPTTARADAVHDWNTIAVNTAIANGQNPFTQARFAAIVQLAVFEAVNAITNGYEPYLGSIEATARASADAAAIAAAHRVLSTYFAASAAALDAARATSLAVIPDGAAKDEGIATGEAAAAAMIGLRTNDGSTPPLFKVPGPVAPGEWQATPNCPIVGGVAVGAFLHWQNVLPFGVPSVAAFLPAPPPALTSNRYAKDYNEVLTVGDLNSPARPQDRSTVARFYAASSSTYLLNLAARQLSVARGRSLSENARELALLNMAVNDALIASFHTKYHYNFWRPETAIHGGWADGNAKTEADTAFAPFILTPCFPSYPSNHASGSSAGAEILRRFYGAAGHSIDFSNPALPGVALHYTSLKEITDDVDDARIFGGIHFRFDQEVGGRLGRELATYVYKNNLRPVRCRE